MRAIKRLSILLILAIGLFYAAAYAAAKPGTIISDLIIYGIVVLGILAWIASRFLNVGQIIKRTISRR